MTERMGVLSSDGRCLQPSPLAARAMLRPAARRLAAVGIGFAGGWAVLYGALMPFGLGLTLGLAEDCFAPCAAGAALGLIPGLLQSGMANTNDIAVFTAMCMCWSGYLSTHVSMMELLHSTRFTAKAILYHTISGLFAGVVANWLFKLLMLIV